MQLYYFKVPNITNDLSILKYAPDRFENIVAVERVVPELMEHGKT